MLSKENEYEMKMLEFLYSLETDSNEEEKQ